MLLGCVNSLNAALNLKHPSIDIKETSNALTVQLMLMGILALRLLQMLMVLMLLVVGAEPVFLAPLLAVVEGALMGMIAFPGLQTGEPEHESSSSALLPIKPIITAG